MLRINNVDYWGFKHAIRGMRNPMNSWERSDSFIDDNGVYNLGKEDQQLCIRLINGGSEHRKFLRQIFVSADITGPLYWWKEFDTYKVGTTANSTSTMHKIHAKPFVVEDFSFEYFEGIEDDVINNIIDTLNHYRDKYLETGEKEWWYRMIQLLPSSYNQKRTVTFDFENIHNIISQRTGHKLTEWHQFCDTFGYLLSPFQKRK
jgi:hypothetical protein